MADLSEIFSSLSKEDLDKLKSAAQTLLSQKETSKPLEAKAPALQNLDTQNVMQMLSLLPHTLSKDNESTAFLTALRPLLSKDRQKKLDEAKEFLLLMDAIGSTKGLV